MSFHEVLSNVRYDSIAFRRHQVWFRDSTRLLGFGFLHHIGSPERLHVHIAEHYVMRSISLRTRQICEELGFACFSYLGGEWKREERMSVVETLANSWFRFRTPPPTLVNFSFNPRSGFDNEVVLQSVKRSNCHLSIL